MKIAGWFLLAAVVWLLYFILMTPLILLGFLLVPLALWRAATSFRKSQRYPGRMVLSWKWPVMQLWGNEEDGICGSSNGFWPAPTTYWGAWKQTFIWSAWRNSVGNARWTWLFGMTVDPLKVHTDYFTLGRETTPGTVYDEYLKTGPYFARQGLRFELKFTWNPSQPDWQKKRIFWIGWRIAQATAITPGVGFAFQPWTTL